MIARLLKRAVCDCSAVTARLLGERKQREAHHRGGPTRWRLWLDSVQRSFVVGVRVVMASAVIVVVDCTQVRTLSCTACSTASWASMPESESVAVDSTAAPASGAVARARLRSGSLDMAPKDPAAGRANSSQGPLIVCRHISRSRSAAQHRRAPRAADFTTDPLHLARSRDHLDSTALRCVLSSTIDGNIISGYARFQQFCHFMIN